MTVATKKEAIAALNAARTKAQHASDEHGRISGLKGSSFYSPVDDDAAHLYYQRCIREFEEAINDMARFETSAEE